MVEVKIDAHGIRMDGHAGYHIDGQDIVCAAISALTCSLINSLLEFTDDWICMDMDSGRTVIEWRELSKAGKLLVDSWFLGITAINQEYKCILFV